MNLLSYEDVENYLSNKQVFFVKQIESSDFKTFAEEKKVHYLKKVIVSRINDEIIAFCILNSLEKQTTIYQYQTDLEFFAWIKQNFIPIGIMYEKYSN